MKNRNLVVAVVGLALIGVATGLWALANRAPAFEIISISELLQPESPAANEGNQVEFEGVVVGDFRLPDQLGGIFVQQVGSDSSSGRQGLFVQCSEHEQVTVGDQIRARGLVKAAGDTIEISPAGQLTSVEIEKTGHLDAVEPIELPPLSQDIDWEDWTGMLVRFPSDMVVTDTYNLARYGQVLLSADRQLQIPTNHVDPNDSDPSGTSFEGDQNASQVATAAQVGNAQTIILDDGFQSQNRDELVLQPESDSGPASLRLGTRIKDLTGVIVNSGGQAMVVPIGPQTIEYAQRPPRPDLGDANLTVASFNVLNYFTTIDDGNNGARGADNQAELDRQRDKLVAAIVAIEADVVGLMELENNLEAEQDLVRALNQKLGEDLYAGVGLPDQFSTAPGAENPIRVAVIYRRDRVEPTGPANMVADDAFENARTPIMQEFQPIGSESKFTLIVNHFKSKGPRSATGPDTDQNDGQSAFNDSRRKQAEALIRYVDSIGTSDQPRKFLIVGDLNAYSQEDPIDKLRASGWVDLLRKHSGDRDPVSYVYRGRAGCLDHAFATAELAADVTAAATWNINSGEPRYLDYNTEFNPQQVYRPDPFRSSDHDPVLVGLRLN